ncbi:tetratricopeptide repeat protein [Teredinibacter turnerae]|uniref:tetratricopeptide repeat protein n=1 Tax=Teredinibacter turnerae TaxID=2426 RepID=UPI0030D3CB5C
MVVATVCFFSLATNGFAAEDNSPLATDSSWQDDNQRGIAAYQQKKYTQAEHYYQQALQASPNNAKVLNNYALVLHQLGRFNDAIAVSNQAIDHSDNAKAQANAYFNKGRALESLERNKEALSAYEQAQRLVGTNARKEAVQRLSGLIAAADAGSSNHHQDSREQNDASDKAVDYRLKITKGSNYALCRDIKAYFEKRKGAVCDFEKDPEFPLLRGAGYREIDINDYADVYMEAYLSRFPEGIKDQKRRNMNKLLEGGEISAWYTIVDGDYDGAKEELVTSTRGSCPVSLSRTFVIKDGQFDAKFSRGIPGSLFFYDGKPFYISVSGKHLHVSEVTSDLSQYPGGGIQYGEVWIWDVCHNRVEG